MLENFRPSKILIIKIIIAIYFAVGVAGLTQEATRLLFQQLIPLTLLSSLAIMLAFHPKWDTRHIWIFALIALLGFWVEVVGIATGVVFGEYAYGEALGFKMLGTPPIIGINWLLLTYSVFSILEPVRISPLEKILAGALMLVGFDIVLEPVAIAFDMWSWAGGAVPLQNYLAWFVISVVFLGIMHLAKIRINNPLAPYMFFVQLAFFIVLNFFIQA